MLFPFDQYFVYIPAGVQNGTYTRLFTEIILEIGKKNGI